MLNEEEMLKIFGWNQFDEENQHLEWSRSKLLLLYIFINVDVYPRGRER